MAMLDMLFGRVLFTMTLIRGFGSPFQAMPQTIPIYPNRFGNCLKKHESELIGSEMLNGEMTSVIRVNIIPSRTDKFLKLWISHNIGFRPVLNWKARIPTKASLLLALEQLIITNT